MRKFLQPLRGSRVLHPRCTRENVDHASVNMLKFEAVDISFETLLYPLFLYREDSR